MAFFAAFLALCWTFSSQNQFLPNSKPVFLHPKPVIADLITGFVYPENSFCLFKNRFLPTQNWFCQSQKRFLSTLNWTDLKLYQCLPNWTPVFANLKSGFCPPWNWFKFLPISKPVFAYFQTDFADLKTGFCRIQSQFLSCLDEAM